MYPLVISYLCILALHIDSCFVVYVIKCVGVYAGLCVVMCETVIPNTNLNMASGFKTILKKHRSEALVFCITDSCFHKLFSFWITSPPPRLLSVYLVFI